MGLLVRTWRERRGLTLQALADRSGVHWVTLWKIENGRMSPTVALLEKLAGALDLRLRDFFPADEWPGGRRARRPKKGGRA